MSLTKSSNLITIWVLVGYFFVQNIPWLYYRVGSKGGLFFFILWFIGAMFSLKINKDRNAQKHAYLFYLFFFLYCSVSWIYPFFEYGTYPGLGTIANNGQILVAFIILHFLNKQKDINALRLVSFFNVLTLLISGFINSRVQRYYDFASRSLTAGDLTIFDAAEYLSAGVAKYDFIFGMCFIAPVLLFVGLKSNVKIKWFMFITYGLLAISVIQAAYFIGTVSLIIGTCLVFAIYQRFLPQPLAIAIMALPVILFFIAPSIMSVLLDPIIWIMGQTDNQQYQVKLGEVQNVIQAGVFSEQGPLGIRLGLYKFSWQNYLEHPIFGNGTFVYTSDDAKTGGHSQILDMMAETGVIGISLAIALFWNFRRYVLAVFPHQAADVRMLLNIFIFPAIFVAFLNPLRTPPIWSLYFFLTPALVTFFKDFDQKEIQGKRRKELRLMYRHAPYV